MPPEAQLLNRLCLLGQLLCLGSWACIFLHYLITMHAWALAGETQDPQYLAIETWSLLALIMVGRTLAWIRELA